MYNNIALKNISSIPTPSYRLRYRVYLKIISNEAGINEKVLYSITQAGLHKEQIQEKWEMVSGHTARRTFATLADLFDVPRNSIIKMTGHGSQSSFLSYLRHTALENALKIRNHSFFNIEFQPIIYPTKHI